MSAPAAIAGSLVNMRNVGTHKSVALTVHVPEELASRVIEAFGWPTAANPVSVAIARLDVKAPEEPKQIEAPKKEFPLSSKVAMTCQEMSFDQFLADVYSNSYASMKGDAAAIIRRLCGVKSRTEIVHGSEAARIWHTIEAGYHKLATGDAMTRRRFSKRALDKRLQAFGGCCAMCRKPIDGASGLEWDHVVPLAIGGEDVIENLQPLCARDHRLKTKGDVGQIAKTTRQRQKNLGVKAPKAKIPSAPKQPREPRRISLEPLPRRSLFR